MNLPKAPTVDPVAVWLLFVDNFGDPARTAIAASLPLQTVQKLSEAGNWPGKLLTYAQPNAGDVAVVTANRAINLSQAHRLRKIADSILEKIEASPEALDDFTTTMTKFGANRTAKPLAELAKVIETAQKLSYQALADDGTADLGTPASVADATEAVAKAFQLGQKTQTPDS